VVILKKLFIFFFIPLILYGENYTYLIDAYTKEAEFEAKIVTKIAEDILVNKMLKLYIPHSNNLDKKIYSQNTILVDSCEKANFVFIKYEGTNNCLKNNTPFLLTNNYKKLIKNPNYIGAFFWSKSRPNIVLVKNRLMKKNIQLSSEYDQFIEDLQ
jgi:hypothetical protein